MALIVGAGLERFSRSIGEAVQVQTVVPVGTADQGKSVRSEVFQCIVEGTFQMLHQGSSQFFFVVEGNVFGEKRGVSGLSDVSGGCGNEP